MNRSDRSMPQCSDRVVLLAAGALPHAAAARGNPHAGNAHPGNQHRNNVTVMRPPMAGTRSPVFSSAAGSAKTAAAISLMSNSSALMRRATTADADALAGLIREPMVAMHQDQASPVTQRDTASIALDDLHDPHIDTLVAEAGEGLQGFLQLRWDARPPSAEWMRGAAEIRRHYVRVRHRGAGVAAGLLEAAVVLARAKEAAGLWLKVGKECRDAVGLYQKHGFQIAGSSIAMEATTRRESWVMHHALRAAVGVQALAYGKRPR